MESKSLVQHYIRIGIALEEEACATGERILDIVRRHAIDNKANDYVFLALLKLESDISREIVASTKLRDQIIEEGTHVDR